MNDDTRIVYRDSIGCTSFCMLLGLLFIGLRLANVIAWSWVWVLAPLWVPVAMVTVILVLGVALLLVSYAVMALVDRWS